MLLGIFPKQDGPRCSGRSLPSSPPQRVGHKARAAPSNFRAIRHTPRSFGRGRRENVSTGCRRGSATCTSGARRRWARVFVFTIRAAITSNARRRFVGADAVLDRARLLRVEAYPDRSVSVCEHESPPER